MNVLIKFKNLNQSYIKVIMRDELNYHLNKFEEDTLRDNFAFGSNEFLNRVCRIAYMQFPADLETEVQRVASRIRNYSFVSDVALRWDDVIDRYTIEVKGKAYYFDTSVFFDSFYGGYIEPTDPELIRKYLENDMKAILDAMKRIPKTFVVYSGYSRDGRLRTVVHWEDGEKTTVYLQNEDFDDIYLAISYCYVKRKFGSMSHFKRIVERNTKEVTSGVLRFKYGADTTLIKPVNPISMYDQVALYLAISYLGDTDQWVSEKDMKRLEDSVNE